MPGGNAPTGDDRFVEPILCRRRPRPQACYFALLVGAIGFPTAIWFNGAVLPTDGPGPIGLGTAIVVVVLLARDPANGQIRR